MGLADRIANTAIRFDKSVVKTGPLYRQGQLIRMPHLLPFECMSSWCRMDGNLRIQLGQRIIEVPNDSEEDRCFTRVIQGDTVFQMPSDWFDVLFWQVGYSINLSKASLVVLGDDQVRVFQQPGSFVVDGTRATEVAAKVEDDDGWLGPYPLHGGNTAAFVHLDEIDRLTFSEDYVTAFTHGKSEEIILSDTDGDLRVRAAGAPGWLSIDDTQRVNVACAAFYATGPNDVAQATKHNQRGLHFGSDATVSIGSRDAFGRDNDTLFAAATRQWLSIVFDDGQGEIRFNPRRVEAIYLDDLNDPKHFILMSEGRYHWNGPLTGDVRKLYASFVVLGVE